MYPTAELCRTQQAIHSERADTTLLENVRIVSRKAAIAWGVEALAAEDRETRRERTKLMAGIIASQKLPAAAGVPLYSSESPDSGVATFPPYR